MKSQRLLAIASLIDKNKSVVDIGTDHGYLPIYLIKNGITKNVLATDISKNALSFAQKNIQKEGLTEQIPTQVSDGFKKLQKTYDIGVIAGMGTASIKNILKNPLLPKELIIQSNNDLSSLRSFLNELGYMLIKEVIIFEGRYYSIMKYVVGKETLSEEEILFGKSNDKKYLNYLLEKYQRIYQTSKKEEHKAKINKLKRIIEKIPD